MPFSRSAQSRGWLSISVAQSVKRMNFASPALYLSPALAMSTKYPLLPPPLCLRLCYVFFNCIDRTTGWPTNAPIVSLCEFRHVFCQFMPACWRHRFTVALPHHWKRLGSIPAARCSWLSGVKWKCPGWENKSCNLETQRRHLSRANQKLSRCYRHWIVLSYHK